jgi:hypothetical protein
MACMTVADGASVSLEHFSIRYTIPEDRRSFTNGKCIFRRNPTKQTESESVRDWTQSTDTK